MGQPFTYNFYSTTASAWEAMLLALGNVQKSVYWEVYILVDDDTGSRFVDVLCDQAKKGLDVKLILDSLGSFSLSAIAEARLRSSGVKLVWFNRLSPAWQIREWLNRVWYRSHRKLLIIDEEVAFVGGVNIRQPFMDWYDLHVRLTGNIVRTFLYGFAKDFIYAGGNKDEVKKYLWPAKFKRFREWRDKAQAILHSPVHAPGRSPFKRAYTQALELARTSFTLVTPYYAPDRKFLQLIARAKQRGVKVDILMPWRTDIAIMRHIGQAFFEATLKAGANLHLLPKMNHAKAISADDSIGVVGSANLTPRNMAFNQEAGVLFSEERMVADLNKIFENWKAEADTWGQEELKKIGWAKRFKNWGMRKLREFV